MKAKNIGITFLLIVGFFVFLRPLIVRQIILRGEGYLGFDMYKDAIRQYKKALLLEPRNVYAKNWLAYTYGRAGDIKEAVKTYQGSLLIAPNNIVAYYDLGMIYAMDKEFEKAKGCFLKASAITREDVATEDDEFYFYHRGSLDMLAICQRRLDGKDREK